MHRRDKIRCQKPLLNLTVRAVFLVENKSITILKKKNQQIT